MQVLERRELYDSDFGADPYELTPGRALGSMSCVAKFIADKLGRSFEQSSFLFFFSPCCARCEKGVFGCGFIMRFRKGFLKEVLPSSESKVPFQGGDLEFRASSSSSDLPAFGLA